MDLIDTKTAKTIDEMTVTKVGASFLMEKAGRKMGEIIFNKYNPKNALIVCGKGGNGGDGLVLARYLYEKNVDVEVYCMNNNFSLVTKEKYDLYKGKIIENLDNLNKYDVIIDAIFGIGLNTSLNEKYIDIINKINNSNKIIVSLDIPSGINSTSGRSVGAFIKSTLCITVEHPKTGLFLEDGLDSYKELKIIKISLEKPNNTIKLIDKEMFKDVFPTRLRNTNKGSFKSATLIASSEKYKGAGLISLNALNMFLMGIGYGYLYTHPSLVNLVSMQIPEMIVRPYLEENNQIKYDENLLNQIMNHSSSIAIGMGLDISENLYLTIKYLLNNFKGTLILDADALNTIAKYGIEILSNHIGKVIITPHIGEFLKLIKKTKEELFINQIDECFSLAKKYNITIILKSSSSIISDGSTIRINSTGNSGLAKAGSGDTLSGLLCGISAYLDILSTLDKASLASFILGKAAEFTLDEYEEECFKASFVAKNISKVINYIKKV